VVTAVTSLAELSTADAPLTIAGREFRSRLMVGTGKYASTALMRDAIAASGAEVVTVAVRRVDLDRTKDEGILAHLDTSRYFLLANTAGCYSVADACRYARIARAAGFNEWVKLEVIADEATLLPDPVGVVEATRILAGEGFQVLAYTNDDLITALRLEDAGAAGVMPLASPIGSGLGLLNPYAIRTIKHRLSVPVIVDAGVGTASDACLTMEQGVDGILMNTGVAAAQDEVVDEIIKYLGSDLVCYRATTPEGLVSRQSRHWDPILAWAKAALGAGFTTVQGIIHVPQPHDAVARVRAAIPRDPWRLGAVHVITTLTGSALIALALARGDIGLDAAWAAAHVDEDWNMELWGRDELALKRRAYRFAEMTAAADVLAEMRRSSAS